VVELKEQLVGVAPPPVLSGLIGADQRVVVVRGPVRRGVAIRRAVAASDVPAVHAQAQVHPPSADPEAVLAPVARWCHLADGPEVAAGVGHVGLLAQITGGTWPSALDASVGSQSHALQAC